MKKIHFIYLLPILLMLCGNSVQAQQGFHFGVNGSLVNSYLIDTKLYGDVDYRPKFTYGPIIGIAAGNNFTNQFGIQVEANYARLGQQFEYDDSTNMAPNFTTQQGKITLDYFQVPVLLKFTGGDYKSRFTAMAGPQFSFLANAYQRVTETGQAYEADGMFNMADIGLLVTAGGDISIWEDLYLNLEMRMYYGFNKANNTRVIPPSPFPQSRQTGDLLHNAYGGLNVGIHYLIRNNKATKE